MKQITNVFVAFFTLFCLTSLSAQTTTSSIKGTVKNSEANNLFGATLQATHRPTGTKYAAVANADGRFSILNARVGGPYTVVVSFVGYQNEEFSDIYLELGKVYELNAFLASDNQKLDEVKIVNAKGKVFGSGRTGAETTIGRRELSTLPTISRSASDFTRLEPSASGGSFGGRNDKFNNYSLNGAIFNNPFGLDAATPGGQTGAQPISLDAIEQIQIATAPFDVTLSGFTGASVNAVTKSGTNEITGTAYTFYRNQDLTGDKIKGEKIFVPALQQIQYGASLGLPIIKNKLFIFGNFEIDERSDLGSNFVANDGNGSVGINESRVLESDLLNVRNKLAGIGYNTGGFQGFTHNSNSRKAIVKLDWNINDNHRLAVVYNWLDASKDKPAHPTAIRRRGPDANTLQFENSGYQINNQLNSFLVELNSKFGQRLTNKLQAGYTHFNDFRNPFSAPAPVITVTKDGSPYIIAGHEPFSINNRLDQKVYQITNNLNYVVGNHLITLGGAFEKFEFKNSFNLKGYGFDVFGSVDMAGFNANIASGYYATQLANAQTTFNAKNQKEAGTDGGWNLAETTVGQLSFYLQDEWNVTDNFKLSYGLRGDKPMYFNTSELIDKFIKTDNSEDYNPSIVYYNPANNKPTTLNSTELPGNAVLLSPRMGFNWDLNGKKVTQLRGGAGVFTGRLPFVWIGNQVSGVDQFFYQIVDKNFKFPQVFRASLGLDHKFDNNIIFTGDVAYNKDINAIHVQNWGLRRPTSFLTGADPRAIYGPNDVGTWVAPWLATERANAYVLTNSNQGRAFNASAKLQKTFLNGLFTSVAYNYLDSKDVNSIEAEITGDAFGFNPALGNVNDAVLANSKYGDKHRVIGVVSKKFKYGGEKWATTFTTFFEYAQGGRFNYTYGGDINNDGSGANDLIFIPTTAQIATMTFSGTGQGAAFDAFISQDEYLSSRRGQYAERYGALSPWRGKWDMKIIQDYNFKVTANKTNTIQLSLDILNVGNLLNSDWGLVQVPTSVQPIGVSVAGTTPTYTFTGAQTKTFNFDASLLSRWQAQFGVRYIF